MICGGVKRGWGPALTYGRLDDLLRAVFELYRNLSEALGLYYANPIVGVGRHPALTGNKTLRLPLVTGGGQIIADLPGVIGVVKRHRIYQGLRPGYVGIVKLIVV